MKADAGTLALVNSEVKKSAPAVARWGKEAVALASLFAARAVRPDEVAALRRKMFEVVSGAMPEVEEAILGRKVWSATQVRLFALLTERVMPKLTNIKVEDDTEKRLQDLSLDELEAIALGKKKAQAVDAVVTEAAVLDDLAERHERREAKQELVRQLATVTAIDEAEKEYIAKRVATPDHVLQQEALKQAGKPQPPHSAETIKKVRFARRKRAVDWWREQGLPEEEVARREAERIRKITESNKLAVERRRARLGYTMGLGKDVEIAETIDRKRRETLKTFRVPTKKGVRAPTAAVKRAAERAKKEAAKREKELNPKVMVDESISGIPDELKRNLRLQDLRRLRPDLFEGEGE